MYKLHKYLNDTYVAYICIYIYLSVVVLTGDIFFSEVSSIHGTLIKYRLQEYNSLGRYCVPFPKITYLEIICKRQLIPCRVGNALYEAPYSLEVEADIVSYISSSLAKRLKTNSLAA